MQEHPVPQNVTGYEFHLIGQMTLKQFMEVAGGVLAAVIINTTNLPDFVKYPLMIIAGLLGAGLAFVPLEGRPLDRWFFAFIKSIYQPTMFFWKKSDTTPPAFTYTPPATLDTSPQIDYTPIRQSRVREYISTVQPTISVSQNDPEVLQAANILKLFDQDPSATPLQHPQMSPTQSIPPTSPSPIPSQQANMGHIIEMEIVPEAKSSSPTPTTPRPPEHGTVEVVAGSGPMGYAQKAGITSDHLAPAPPQPSQKLSGTLQVVASRTTGATLGSIRPAQPLKDFPFPNKPTQPNMLAGMVVDSQNKIIENAILTIQKQSDNTPVRAMKTNTLGQFAVVTPLESGNYVIVVEKDGFNFDKYSLVLNNQVVEPILLQASA